MFTDQLGTAESQLGNMQLAKFYAPPVYDQEVNQSLTFTQQAIAGAVFNRSVEHTLTLTQLALHPIDEDVEQTLTLSQTVDVVKARSETLHTPLTLSHSVTVASDFVRSVHQGLPLTHSATRIISRNKEIAQSLTLSQLAVGVSSKHTSSTLVLSQQADVEYVYGARSTLELTQQVAREITVSKKVYSNLVLLHSVAINGLYRKTVSQTLTLTQTVSYQLVKAASNHLNLMQTVEYTKSKGINQTLTLSQTVSVSKSIGRTVSQVLPVRQSGYLQKSKAVSAFSVLGMSQFVRATKVISVSVTSVLVLTQDLVRDRTFESIEDVLDLQQEATAQKIAPREVSQQLSLSQSVSVSKTIVRSVEHTLTFNTSFQKYTGIIDFPFVDVPTVQVVKVRKIVVLQSGSSVIVLPSPEFGDSHGNPSRINVKRAMNGTRRLYKRKTPTNKLQYTFILDRVKAIELRSFIMANNSRLINMENWKGEKWAVLMTNNPFSFSEDAYWASTWGNKCSITLEFEGVRLN